MCVCDDDEDEFGTRRRAPTQSIVVIGIPCPRPVTESCDVHSGKNGLMTSAESISRWAKKLGRRWHFISNIAAPTTFGEMEVFGSMSKSFKLTQHTSKRMGCLGGNQSGFDLLHSQHKKLQALGREMYSAVYGLKLYVFYFLHHPVETCCCGFFSEMYIHGQYWILSNFTTIN